MKCGVPVRASENMRRDGRGLFCSRRCANSYRVGELNPQWRGGGSGDASKSTEKFRRQFPEKTKAHRAVYAAVRRGDLIRLPCEVCGVQPTHAHHDDYSKPLDVRWLCNAHHKQQHVDA